MKLLVIDAVGMTLGLLEHAPRLNDLARRGFIAPMDGVLPAVTSTVQATMLTGTLPREHGIVANGWYFRDLAEVWLWRQSNHLVQGSTLLHDLVHRPRPSKVAKMFWWFNMYSPAQISVTPRPQYPADGRKIPDVYSEPAELGVELQARLGAFPLFHFWGPTASIVSSRWITDASLMVAKEHDPDLLLVYLPHLDYDLQRWGPHDPRIAAEVGKVDALCGELIDLALERGAQVDVVSEYGVTPASGSVEINRVLRREGWLRARATAHGELLDPGASRAFAVADHQVAHVYVRDEADRKPVCALLEATEGIERVLKEAGKRETGLDHPRSGELVAISERDRYFAYHYWLDDRDAPDFARAVDIHRKPGYDPGELVFDPAAPFLKLRLLATLLRKKLGFRYVMNAISMRSDLAKGSHGRLPERDGEAPILISSSKEGAADRVAMTRLRERWRRAVLG